MVLEPWWTPWPDGALWQPSQGPGLCRRCSRGDGRGSWKPGWDPLEVSSRRFMVSHVVWQSSGWSWCSLLGLGPSQRLGIRSENKYGLVEHFVHHYSAWVLWLHGKRGLHRSLLEQVIFVCTNNFVIVCVYVCKSAFCLFDNNCLCSLRNIACATSWFCVCVCSPWNIASATWEQEIPLTVEETLHHHSLRRKSILKLCSCLQTWTFMSCQKTNSVSTTSFMKLVSSGLQTHLGLGGVDDNDLIWPIS